MVLIRHPIVIRSPEGREARPLIVAVGPADNVSTGFLGQSQVGHEHVVLSPPHIAAIGSLVECHASQRNIVLFERHEAKRKDGVQFRVLDVALGIETLGRRQGQLAIDLARGQHRQLGVQQPSKTRDRFLASYSAGSSSNRCETACKPASSGIGLVHSHQVSNACAGCITSFPSASVE